MAEADRAHDARLDVLNKHAGDPVRMDAAIRSSAALIPVEQAIPNPPKMLLRSAAERISHWEYLWSKVFYDATNQTTDWRNFRNLNVNPAVESELRDALRTGLHCTSLEQCVRTLKMIQDQIEKIVTNNDAVLEVADEKEDTLAELREMRQRLKVLPKNPEKKLMKPPPPPPPLNAQAATG
jgi:hypothetical protein